MPLIVFTLFYMILEPSTTVSQCIGLSILITGIYMLGKRKVNKMRKHELKILPKYYGQVVHGYKTFEVRYNDRNFMVNDIVLLREYEDGEYTGSESEYVITYVLTSEEFKGVSEGYCMFSIRRCGL